MAVTIGRNVNPKRSSSDVKVKKSRAGLDAKMNKKGYELDSSYSSGAAKNEAPTGSKSGQLGGHVKKTVQRTSVYKKKADPSKRKQVPMFRKGGKANGLAGKVKGYVTGGKTGDKTVGTDSSTGAPIKQSDVDKRKAAHQNRRGHSNIPTTKRGGPETLATMTSRARTADALKDKYHRELMTPNEKKKAQARKFPAPKYGNTTAKQSSTRVARRHGGLAGKIYR